VASFLLSPKVFRFAAIACAGGVLVQLVSFLQPPPEVSCADFPARSAQLSYVRLVDCQADTESLAYSVWSLKGRGSFEPTTLAVTAVYMPVRPLNQPDGPPVALLRTTDKALREAMKRLDFAGGRGRSDSLPERIFQGRIERASQPWQVRTVFEGVIRQETVRAKETLLGEALVGNGVVLDVDTRPTPWLLLGLCGAAVALVVLGELARAPRARSPAKPAGEPSRAWPPPKAPARAEPMSLRELDALRGEQAGPPSQGDEQGK